MTTRMSEAQVAVRAGLLNEAASLRKVVKALRQTLPSVSERLDASAEALERHAAEFVAKDERIKALTEALSRCMEVELPGSIEAVVRDALTKVSP